MKEPRLLRAEEIEVRVGAIYTKGITLLLYKNARVDMVLLDETFGPLSWQRKHFKIDEAVFCELSVKNDETGEWITRTDVGTPSYSEPIKGAASDSLKRAAVNFGIGRELYTAPFIWIPSEKVEMREDKGRQVVKDSFFVQSITYDEKARTINGLVIANGKNQVVYQFMDYREKRHTSNTDKITQEQTVLLLNELKRTGLSLSSVLRKHKLNKISDMSPKLWETAMEALREVEDRAA